MTDRQYIESLLKQIDNLQQDNLKLRRDNTNLRKSVRHLKRVIKGYKDKITKNMGFYRNGQKGRTRNG